MITNNYDTYSDKQIVDGIVHNDRKMIEYFFCRKCSNLFSYITVSMFDRQINTNELVSELFLYFAKDNWYKLKQFDYRSSLLTWTSVVSIRYFQKKRNQLIENYSTATLLSNFKETINSSCLQERQIDVMNAIKKMKNNRYKEVIYALDIQEISPETYAKEKGISVSNLYNLHHRALIQLKSLMHKEDYYD